MVVLEPLVVGEVARTRPVEDGANESWVTSSDPARCLDVLGGVLWLSGHGHQPESLDVDADGQHVRREDDVDRPARFLVRVWIERLLEPVEDLRDVGGGLS